MLELVGKLNVIILWFMAEINSEKVDKYILDDVRKQTAVKSDMVRDLGVCLTILH